MPKNLVKEILVNEDLKETGFNMATAWVIGQIVNTISNSVFHIDLNKYHFIKHFVGGVGIGTLAYKKAGGGIKGGIAAFISSTCFNLGWEYFENRYVFNNTNFINPDTISDVSVVYVATILGFFGEKFKDYVNPKERYPRGKEKWLL